MKKYKNIEVFIGDEFFFDFIEEELIETLKYDNLKKHIISSDNFSDFDNAVTGIFSFLHFNFIILRNPTAKEINHCVPIITKNQHSFMLIEINADDYDHRIKLLQELEKEDCLYKVGVASSDKLDVFDLAILKNRKIFKMLY